MTDEEYYKTGKRVKRYSRCKSDLKRLEEERSQISNGILEITTFYQRKIDCCGREEFQTRLKESLLNFYDSEIENVKSEVKAI